MNEKHWTESLTDGDYRKAYPSTQEIQCVDCDFQYCGNRCNNLYHHPVVPAGFACKNGRLKSIDIDVKKMSLFEKFLCNIIGHHELSDIIYRIEGTKYILTKCDCCGRYGVSIIGISNIEWYDNITDQEMPIEVKQYIEKLRL